MFMFQTLKYLPPHILGIEGELLGILGFGLAGLVLALVPFLDRGTSRASARAVTTAAVLGIASVLTLTALGYMASPTK